MSHRFVVVVMVIVVNYRFNTFYMNCSCRWRKLQAVKSKLAFIS